MMLAGLLAAAPAGATLVMFQWTPERILLAADSLAAKIHANGAVDTVTECKIHQQGNIFFTIVGINDDPHAKVDLVALAAWAAGSSKDLRGVMQSFEAVAREPVGRLWGDLVKHQSAAAHIATATDGVMTITVIFVSRKEQAIAVKEYVGGSAGTVTENPARFYGSARGMTQDRGYVAVGIYADAQGASGRQLTGMEGVPFVNSFFEVQIAHELERERQRGAARIGGPVCILEVMSGSAHWAGGQHGPCGPIAP